MAFQFKKVGERFGGYSVLGKQINAPRLFVPPTTVIQN